MEQLNLLVTGAGGFLGKAITQALTDQGHRVKAVYRTSLPEAFMNHALIEPVQGDIGNLDFMISATRGIDGVFHVAAFAKPWAKNPGIYYEINERGTVNVCEACIVNGVKRIVLTASAGIHGPQQGMLIDEETWPERYFTDYEQSKNQGRLAALAYMQKGLEVVTVSPARVYGPGEVTESNVPVRLMKLYLSRRMGIVPASGEGVGSYVHIDDVVNGHLLAMTKGVPGEEYLLGGDNRSYNEFFETLAKVTGKHYPVLKVPYPLSLMVGKSMLFMAENFNIPPKITTPWVRRYLQDWGISTKKIGALGYTPLSLEEGMRKVIPLIPLLSRV